VEVEPKTFRLISLGCPKNLVDSEVIAGALMGAGWKLVAEGPAQVALVNTCAFVTDSAQESVDILVEQAEAKQAGEIELLVATGCLPEKYRAEVGDSISEVDLELGTEDFFNIVSILEAKLAGTGSRSHLSSPVSLYDENTPRLLSTPPWRAYLKLAEGCDNRCAYCIIPNLRGSMRSRAFDSVIAEAGNLAAMDVREITLVAQDTTLYGADRPGEPGLAELLTELDRIENLHWLRVLYAHPAHLTEPILQAMADAQRVTPYLDLPIQHASDPILKRMNRKAGLQQIETMLARARTLIPELFIRTTFITGLPGETEEDFARLMDFVAKWRFAHVGAFAYSPEEDTPAYRMDDRVPEELAQERCDRLMELQQTIAQEVWAELRGTEQEVLVEEALAANEPDDFTHVGRISGQAPEIDGVTFCRMDPAIEPGEFVKVKIVDSTDYDLFATGK
jgi:ribosomal protein S12 methylthiotransferase